MTSNLYTWEAISAMVGVLCVGLGGWIIYQRLKKTTAVYLALLTIFSGFWILGVYFSDLSNDFKSLIFYTRFAMIAALFLVASFLAFSIALREFNQKIKKPLYAYIPFLFLVPIMVLFPENLIYIKDPFLTHDYLKPVGGQLATPFYFFILVYFVYYIFGLKVLYRNYKTLDAEIKKQILYISLGASFTVCGGILFDCVLPIFGWEKFYFIGPLFSLFLIIFSCYAIFKHKLLGVKVIVQRSLIYVLVLSALTFVYFGILFSGLYFFNNSIEKQVYIFSSYFSAILGSIFYLPLLKLFRKVTDKWFYKDAYDYTKAMSELSQVLNQNLDIKELTNDIEKTLQKYLKNNFVSLELDIKIIKSFKRGADKLIPIFLKNKLIGSLVLGPKLSGDAYSLTDLDLLNTFANQAAVALEKARLFQEVKKYSEELEKMVDSRTSKIKDLQQAQNRMMLDISHAIQTPLTVIKSQLSLVAKKLANTEEMDVLEKTLDQISKHVYDLLRLGRLEAREEKFQFENFSLTDLVKEVLEQLSIVCEANNISLESKIEENIYFRGDRRKLEELLNNLLGNAVKYISNKKIISITLKKHDGLIIIEVRDTGQGIESRALSRIFDNFYRASSSAYSAIGMGVGLAISKKIAEVHGGSIYAKSELGVGSTFWVELPLLQI